MSLNKAERLKREREDTAEEVAELRLEPAFPYALQPFDPTFFDGIKKIDKKGN